MQPQACKVRHRWELPSLACLRGRVGLRLASSPADPVLCTAHRHHTARRWIIIAMVWGLLAAATCLLLPWWESREHLMGIFTGAKNAKLSTPPGMASPMPVTIKEVEAA